MLDMKDPPKKRKPQRKAEAVPASEPTRYPSRDNYRSCYLPKELYARLEAVAEEEDRSVSYMVRRAVEAYLKAREESGS